MDKAQYEKKTAIQKQIQSSADEINQLKKSCQVLRDELETLKFEKKEAIQKTILNSSDEINQLGVSEQLSATSDKVPTHGSKGTFEHCLIRNVTHTGLKQFTTSLLYLQIWVVWNLLLESTLLVTRLDLRSLMFGKGASTAFALLPRPQPNSNVQICSRSKLLDLTLFSVVMYSWDVSCMLTW